LDGIVGTDIFCKAGLLLAAFALLGDTDEITVVGFIIIPLSCLVIGEGLKSLRSVSYWPGPGPSIFLAIC
jgi:hypothetical protein